MRGLDLLVPVLHQKRGDEVHRRYADSRDSERPLDAHTLDYRLARQAIDQTTKATSGCSDAVGDAPPAIEPLGDDTNRSDIEERRAPAEEETLGDKEMPCFGCEASGDEGTHFEHEADQERGTRTDLLACVCDEGCDEGDL